MYVSRRRSSPSPFVSFQFRRVVWVVPLLGIGCSVLMNFSTLINYSSIYLSLMLFTYSSRMTSFGFFRCRNWRMSSCIFVILELDYGHEMCNYNLVHCFKCVSGRCSISYQRTCASSLSSEHVFNFKNMFLFSRSMILYFSVLFRYRFILFMCTFQRWHVYS